MSKKPKKPKIQPGWRVAQSVTRTDVMHTRIHGQRSRRTERRQARQRGWTEE